MKAIVHPSPSRGKPDPARAQGAEDPRGEGAAGGLSPAEILALAAASFVDIPASDLHLLTRKLKEPEQ